MLVAVLLAARPSPAEAQRLPELAWSIEGHEAMYGVGESGARRPGAGRAFFLSLAVPGAGQRATGARRWVAYTALEAWAWYRYAERRREGHWLEHRYKDLAWEVARRDWHGAREDGDFGYFEAMGRYPASGAFDLDPGGPTLRPETDERTYNGAIWALARAIYLPADTSDPAPDSPEYREALEYYRRRAVREPFAWSWVGSEAEHDAYRELIRESDAAIRAMTVALGLIFANHFVSAVDALVTTRLSTGGNDTPSLRIESRVHFDGPAPAWSVGVRWTGLGR